MTGESDLLNKEKAPESKEFNLDYFKDGKNASIFLLAESLVNSGSG